MSRMIPSRYDEATYSPGEKQIFRAMEKLPDDYTVFHSLGLANHSYLVYGEIDFVVVCPDGVLCLEVKGGNVYRDEGTWIHTTRHGDKHESHKNPFQQVLGAANSLREEVRGQLGPRHQASKCCYASGIMFPDMSFNFKSPEIISEIIYTIDTSDLETYIKQVFAYWRTRLRDKLDYEPDKLTPGNIDSLAKYLRGNLGFAASLGASLTQTEEELVYLTEEQKKCLHMIGANPRIVLEGGAGTGKTVLCVEQAVKRASMGQKVIFVCFNHNLAYYLHHHVASNYPTLVDHLYVRVFHQLLEDYLREQDNLPIKPEAEQNDYWTRELPAAFVDTISSLGSSQYDYLVIDEGQDLLNTEYLLCLDPLLKGGFSEGEWLLVLDPKQNLYGIDIEDGLHFLLDCRPARFALSVNCRNTKQIVEYTQKATGICTGQQLQADGPRPKSVTFKNQAEQQRLVIKEVLKLLSQGIKPQDITVLSPHRLQNSCLAGKRVLGKGAQIQDIGGLAPQDWDEKSIRFSTLYRFKGLESPVIFLVDVDSFAEEQQQIRNYTAMTRAKSILYVFHDEAAAGLE